MPLLVPARAPRRRARSLLGAATAASVVLLPFALVGPASAHDELVSTAPADGSSLAEAPEAVTLTFGEDVVELGTAVVVVDAAGVKLADGALAVDGAVVTRPIAPPTVAGTVTVSYRVVSADGHPVTGTFAFTVTSSASPSAAPSGTSESPEPSESESSTSPSASEASPSIAPVSSESSGSALPWVLGGLALLALAGAAVAALRQSRAGSGS